MKITAWGDSPGEAIGRMARALGESRVQGVASNLEFLEHVIAHPAFASGECTTRFIDETPELAETTPSGDSATPLLQFLGVEIVNGKQEMHGRLRPTPPLLRTPVPSHDLEGQIPPGSRERFRDF